MVKEENMNKILFRKYHFQDTYFQFYIIRNFDFVFTKNMNNRNILFNNKWTTVHEVTQIKVGANRYIEEKGEIYEIVI